MGLFSGIKEAKPSQGGTYLEAGIYQSRIDACKSGKARDGIGFFVVELEHLQSNNPHHPAGSRVSWMVKLDPSYLETALGNIKTFLAVAGDCDESEVDEAGTELAVSAANPLKGVVLNISATNIKTKAGKDFTKAMFKLVKEVAAATAAA
jgi:hypothetical protein